MRKELYKGLKAYLREEFLKCRHTLNIPQEEMAHRLLMSTRAYVSLEGGKFCCNLVTVSLFLSRCCTDRVAFLDGLLRTLESSASKSD